MSALMCADKKLRDAQEELWAIFARQRAGEEVDAELEEAAATVDYWSIEIEVLTAHEKYIIAQTEWTDSSSEVSKLLWSRDWEAQAAKDGDAWKGAASRAALMHDRSVRALRMKNDTLLGKMIDAEIVLDQIRKAASRRTALLEDKAVTEYMARAKACWPEDKPWDEEVMREKAEESVAEWRSQQAEINERIMRKMMQDEEELDEEIEEEKPLEEEDDGRELCDFCGSWSIGLVYTADDGQACQSCAAGFHARKEEHDEEDIESLTECSCEDGIEACGEHFGLTEVTDVRASLIEHDKAIRRTTSEPDFSGYQDDELKQEAKDHLLEIQKWFEENGDKC